MLKRRKLRVKAFQSLYAYEQGSEVSLTGLRKNLLHSIDKVYHCSAYNLFLLSKIISVAELQAEVKASKYLPTEEDKTFSTVISRNPVIHGIMEDSIYGQVAKEAKVNARDSDDLNRQIFNQLKETDEYKTYVSSTDLDLKAEIDIIKFLYNELLIKNDVFLTHMEEEFVIWEDDAYTIQTSVTRVLENHPKKGTKTMNKEFHLSKEDRDFSWELARLTINNNEAFTRLLEPKLVNWELDRIAMVDTILMKMAICELLNFPTIPVKVTINEYIDISKIYSTPKSREFVNGVLDSLMKELKESDAIRKTGRGLME